MLRCGMKSRLSSRTSGNEGVSDASTDERSLQGRKCLFKAKRRCTTSVELMSSASRDGAVEQRTVVRKKTKRKLFENTEQQETLPASNSNRERQEDSIENLDQNTDCLSNRKTLIPSFSRNNDTSSGYQSNSSQVLSRTRTSSNFQGSFRLQTDFLSELNNLRSSYRVFRPLFKQLNLDFIGTELSTPALAREPTHGVSFVPELIEYGLRLAYLDILSPRQSGTVGISWLKGMEFIAVHIFKYGVIAEEAFDYSSDVEKCLKMLKLIAAEIPEVNEKILTLLELTLRKKVPNSNDQLRQYIAHNTRLLCKNCPRMTIGVLKVLVAEFCCSLNKLHQNSIYYASHRSVTLFHSNLILDILLQLPKGCSHAIMNVFDDLRNIPTDANLMRIAKQDIIDYLDFILQS